MALRVKFKTLFPANVTASSPLTLTKTGLSYAFDLSITSLRQSLDPIYLSQTGRIRLIADTIFYFDNAKADDSGNGLTALTAKKTLQAVADLVAQNYDLAGYQAIAQAAPGSYSSASWILRQVGPFFGGNPRGTTFPSASVVPFLVRGDPTSAATIANYVLTSTASDTILADAGAYFGIEGFKIISAGDGLRTGTTASILHGAVIFGACTGAKRHAAHSSVIESYANYWQDGNCTYVNHVSLNGSIWDASRTETLLSNMTVTAYARSYDSGSSISMTGMTFTSGAFSVTGSKFVIGNGGSITTGTSGDVTYFPGSTAGTMIWGSYDDFNYDGTVWSTFTVKSLTTGAAAGPAFSTFRANPSPAANDLIGKYSFFGNNSTPAFSEYGRVQGKILVTTAGSESGQVLFQTKVTGTLANRWIIGAGAYTPSATGGDKGAETLNVAGHYYENGAPIGISSGGTGAPNGAIILLGYAKAINANSVADTAIPISMPAGTSTYRLQSILFNNVGTTAILTVARAGVFSSTGGGGTTLAADQVLSGATSNAVNTVGAASSLTVNSTAYYNFATVQFRIGTAQGAAATIDVYVYGFAFP